ncbi:hypothetical protein A2U01_0083625, partial [Trifolium medium]|nr:hypothetical protein [Trifolium medium]
MGRLCGGFLLHQGLKSFVHQIKAFCIQNFGTTKLCLDLYLDLIDCFSMLFDLVMQLLDRRCVVCHGVNKSTK